jgi:ribose/xylose/arabinose/galactoside ABC-type transport system permease subunit
MRYHPAHQQVDAKKDEHLAQAGAIVERQAKEVHGLFFGIAQAVNIGRIGSVNNSMGIGTEFTVMAGCMLGGVKMGGGGGKMSNMVVGVLIIGVLNSGMNFLNMSQYWQYVALGVVLLAAIIIDTMQGRSVQKRAKLVAGQDPALAEKKG